MNCEVTYENNWAGSNFSFNVKRRGGNTIMKLPLLITIDVLLKVTLNIILLFSSGKKVYRIWGNMC